MSDNPTLTTAVTVAAVTEVAKNAYNDIAHPSLAATGKVIALIPQIIDRALLPVQKWVAEGQYKLAETKKLLGKKLENVSPENIVSPESHIAVPALQAISYSMDNEEIRNMYANLLTSSMHEKVKNDVHPAFVEIIKQLSPDEAKILKYVHAVKNNVPLISFRVENISNRSGSVVYKYLSPLHSEIKDLEYKKQEKIVLALENLERQNLIVIEKNYTLTDKQEYESLFCDKRAEELLKQKLPEGMKWDWLKTYFSLTEFGKIFCDICISDDIIILEVENDQQ